MDRNSKENLMSTAWRTQLNSITHGACRGCALCDGHACAGEVPGMGGKGEGLTFMHNVLSWDEIGGPAGTALPEIAVAPITGVDENIGDAMPERDFHDALVAGAGAAGIFSCIGDGVPDYKFTDGVDALRRHGRQGAIIIKPHVNRKILERYEMAQDVAESVGTDIDACTLVTVESKAGLEKKDAALLKDLRREIRVPFIIKGICRDQELELVEAVRPDIVVISNHGGRVADGLEGIAWSLERLVGRVRKYCGEVWVDGGLRTRAHLHRAAALGAKRVLIARPFIQGVVALGADGIPAVLRDQFGIR